MKMLLVEEKREESPPLWDKSCDSNNTPVICSGHGSSSASVFNRTGLAANCRGRQRERGREGGRVGEVGERDRKK